VQKYDLYYIVKINKSGYFYYSAEKSNYFAILCIFGDKDVISIQEPAKQKDFRKEIFNINASSGMKR
jgi:hypothetical protein